MMDVLSFDSKLEKETLLLCLMDSIVNSTTLMDAEKEIITHIYHRIKSDEE